MVSVVVSLHSVVDEGSMVVGFSVNGSSVSSRGSSVSIVGRVVCFVLSRVVGGSVSSLVVVGSRVLDLG